MDTLKKYDLKEIKESDYLKIDYFYIYVQYEHIVSTSGVSSAYSYSFKGYQKFLLHLKYWFVNGYILSNCGDQIDDSKNFVDEVKSYLGTDCIENESEFMNFIINLDRAASLQLQPSDDNIGEIINKFNSTFDEEIANPSYKILAYGNLKTFISMLVKLKNDELYSLDKKLSELQSLSNKEKIDQNDMDQIRSILIRFNLNP